MSTVPKIESHNLSVAELFKDFYSVPDFQREYVWKTDNVKKLFYDIVEELYDDDEPDNDSEYFLGSIVVFRDESGTFQLVDGQQRLTTIYMFFCAIRDLLCDFEYPTSRTIEERISGVAQDPKTGWKEVRATYIIARDNIKVAHSELRNTIGNLKSATLPPPPTDTATTTESNEVTTE